MVKDHVIRMRVRTVVNQNTKNYMKEFVGNTGKV